MKRISYLLPTFERAQFIAESISSILEQATEDDEILVIDDGSCDATAQVVRGFSSRVVYTYQENKGKSAALNRGLKMSSGKFVIVCDDDDVLRPGVVPILLNELISSGAGYAFGRYSRFRTCPDGKREDIGTGYWPDLSTGSLTRHILEDAFIMQNAALVRRDAYSQVGPFDETMLRSLDYDMFVRLGISVRGVFVDRYIFDQRKHDGVRGPARALHKAGESEKVWLNYDQRIFERLYRIMPIERYEQLFVGSVTPVRRRAALLQRACVNARHSLWEYALGDLEAALVVAASTALSECEREIAGRMLNGKHGSSGVLQPVIRHRLKSLATKCEIGSQIVRSMLSGGLWQLREPTRAKAMWDLINSLVGRAGAVWLLTTHKLYHRQRTPSDVLNENLEPPFLQSWQDRAIRNAHAQ